MTDNIKTTVPGASVGADAVQSSDKITTNIITNSDKQVIHNWFPRRIDRVIQFGH